VQLCDTTDHEQIETEFAKGCARLYLETPTNPTVKITDIFRLSRFAVVLDLGRKDERVYSYRIPIRIRIQNVLLSY